MTTPALRFSAESSSRVIHDAGITLGAALAAGYAARRGIHCNTEGTYRIYDVNGASTDRYLLAGVLYPYANTKITDTSDNDLTDGAVSAEA